MAMCDEYHTALLCSVGLNAISDHYHSCRNAHAVCLLDEDGKWRGIAVASLLSLLVQAAARDNFPVQAVNSVAESLHLWQQGAEGTALVTIHSLLPGPPGSASRSILLSEQHVAVPAFALPVAAGLMPEISHRLVPIRMSFQEWQRVSSESVPTALDDPLSLPRGSMHSTPRRSIHLRPKSSDRVRVRFARGLRAIAATAPGKWARIQLTNAGLVGPGAGVRILARLEEPRGNPFMAPESSPWVDGLG